MKTLLIRRHAKSKPGDPRALVPDLIISSSALRAKTTAEIVAEGCSMKEQKLP